MTNQRRKTSGGQALVMVTLSLIAMAGLMGLAVDLGWSYFVQKEAQAAADGAALAAAEEVFVSLDALGIAPSAVTCATIANSCQPTPLACGSVSSTPLKNGCLYAKTNGFDYTSGSSRQNVTIQANDHSTLPPTAPGVIDVKYWVTVRTVQTIPQLFSAVLGNTLGTVSAIGTAGIVGSIQPGSFYGMNHKGDCLTGTAGPNCGVDVQVGGGGGGLTCVGAPGGTANLCAPAGIILGSSCNGTAIASQCSGGDGAYAGTVKGNGSVYGSSMVAMDTGDVGVNGSGSFSPAHPTSVASNSDLFKDPTFDRPQPPLQAPSSPLVSCGYLDGQIPSSVTQLGPFQYYSYHSVDSSGKPIPSGTPIILPNNVSFSSSITSCQGNGAVQSPTGASPNSALPAYIFWGGMITGNTANFGPGQYVMAGTNLNTDGATVFNATGSTIQGDSTMGTMFIFTDGSYPGLQATDTSAGQVTNLPNYTSLPTMYQGSITFKGADITLTGLVNSTNGSGLPTGMDQFAGVAWWQDRRNSTVEYNKDYVKDYRSEAATRACTACDGNKGVVINCADCSAGPQTAAEVTENHVTPSSPGVVLKDGNAKLNIKGVWYQPRGAWLQLEAGTAGIAGTNAAPQVPLQVITGALLCDNGCGSTGLLLAGPTNPLIRYKVSLIQ